MNPTTKEVVSMKRTPIEYPSYEVTLSKEPLTFSDLIPKYRYTLRDATVPEESTRMYLSLLDFLETNNSLAVENNEFYQRGFQKALALTRLWIDTIYVSGKSL